MKLSGVAKTRRKTVLWWTNYGPYHYARASALASRCELLPFQLASFQRKYGWSTDAESSIKVTTILEGDWEAQAAWQVAFKLLKMLQSENPEVVIIPGYHSIPGVVSALWGKLRGRRNILMFESTEEDHPRNKVKEALKGLLVCTLFDRASVGGSRTSSYLKKLGFPPASIGHYYDVVNNEFYTTGTRLLRSVSNRDEYNLPAKYFLYVGRLAPEKNLLGLLDAFGIYLARGGERSLVLVGTGNQRELLGQHDAVVQNPRRVHFAGFKNGRELLPYYAFADCFVLPSMSEPWGLVVNEAMASALPVIVSRRCGCADDLVTHGDNGLLVDPSSVGGMAEALLKLDSLSFERLADMGARSLTRIADYSPDNWAKEIIRLTYN
jgi:1,2-diacylglycerol 3-alpha-glucosyltransferase